MVGALQEIGIWVDVSTKKHPETFMLVSVIDYSIASQQKWSIDKTGYAVAKVGERKKSFHRLVMSACQSDLIDHINRDPLDNRRSNLRLADRSLNSHNRTKKPGTSSQFVGVSWRASKRRWEAEIRINGKSTKIGKFKNELEAALAYDRAAIECRGLQANINLICSRLCA